MKITPGSVGIFLPLLASPLHASPVPLEERAVSYDYIILGGGTAGLTLANRLSANPKISVAVVEGGAHYEITNPALSATPAGDVLFVGSDPSDTQSLIDWNFITTPQAGASSRKVHYARGKTLGGSSARNFMIYQRGSVGSYQKWADSVGDQSYTFSNLLPFFKKSVQFTPPKSTRASNATALYNADAFDPAGGPLQVSYANYAGPFSSYVQGAFQEIGIPTVQDFNSGSLLGAQYCSSTIDPSTQTRDSSEASFLQAAQSRSNLRVYANTLARKVLFDSSNNAIGAQVQNAFGGLSTLTANKEVIISAGAFQSPQLLMVSGIGPATILQKLNIPVISNLAGVGQNMIDHIFFGPTYRVKVDTFTRLANNIGFVLGQFLGPYSFTKTGPLTNPVADFLAWEKVPSFLKLAFSPSALVDLASFPADWPELEYITAPGYVGNFSNLQATQPKDGYQYASILATLVAPMSRGTVTISSSNTNDLPIINPNWLTSKTDQQVAIAGYKRARQAFASKYMSGGLSSPVEYYPGPQVQTDAQILKAIQDSLMTVWHASGTAKMGLPSDSSAVVDSKARVFGVQGLRVVDASIFPVLPPGHPQSTVYAIAEKIADSILSGQ